MPPNRRMFWKVRATRACRRSRSRPSAPGGRRRRRPPVDCRPSGEPVDGIVAEAAAVAQRDAALGRLVEAGDAVEDRGLAGAVRADEGGDVAAADVEGEIVDGDEAAEAHGQVLDRRAAGRRASGVRRRRVAISDPRPGRPCRRRCACVSLQHGGGRRAWTTRPRGRQTMISTMARPKISMRYCAGSKSVAEDLLQEVEVAQQLDAADHDDRPR